MCGFLAAICCNAPRHWRRVVLLALVIGFDDLRLCSCFPSAQTINDWYDREIDAINEPYRPIPSGAISEVSCASVLPLSSNEENFWHSFESWCNLQSWSRAFRSLRRR